MNFYGREHEIKTLQRFIHHNRFNAAMIFGRRRVGKSELILHCLKNTDIPSIYYECRETTELSNLNHLSVLLSETFGFPKPDFSSIEELLDFLFRNAIDKPLVLVLDEYPYLRQCVTGLDSILQSVLDTYRDTSSLKLILCGSYVDIMQSLQMRDNPLYGRIDQVIELKPMNYQESSLFYSSFSNEDKVRLYSVFGGIPYYNRLIDPDLSVRENLLNVLIRDDAQLINEVDIYLKSEIRRIINANEVFDALSRGFSRFNDILSQSHVSSSPTLSDVLDKLIRMGMVKKEEPINDENNRRKSGYYISDNLCAFYFKYIFRYSSQRLLLDEEVFFDRYINEDFETSYVPHAFEEICKQYLILQNKSGNLDTPFDKIGKFYYDDPASHKNGEFDIVTSDPYGYIFYEAKFQKKPVTRQMIEEEIEEVKQSGLNCYQYGFFSRSGFDTTPENNMVFYTLEDLYQ